MPRESLFFEIDDDDDNDERGRKKVSQRPTSTANFVLLYGVEAEECNQTPCEQGEEFLTTGRNEKSERKQILFPLA